MENNCRFYAIVGKNGVAVMDTYKAVVKLKKYIRNPEVTGFDSFDLAEFWALAKFQERSCYGKHLSYLNLNHPIFNKDIRGWHY